MASDCPFHGSARLWSCGHCRRAMRNTEYAQRSHVKRRKERAERRANPNRPPPTEAFYVDHPECNTAEDLVAIMKTMVKEFGR